jgi:hypothetical protein
MSGSPTFVLATAPIAYTPLSVIPEHSLDLRLFVYSKLLLCDAFRSR